MNLFIRRVLAAHLVAIFLFTAAFGQAPASASSFSDIEREIIEKITVSSIKDSTTALTATEMEGRGTGQPGGDRAANWIAQKFTDLGLKPLGDKGTYFQKIDFKETTVLPDASFSAGNAELAHGSEFALLPQNNGNRNASGDAVFVAYGIQADAAGIDQVKGVNISGKVVVMLEGPPPGTTEQVWREKNFQQVIMRNLVMGGAAALVFIGTGEEKRPPEMMIDYFSRRQLSLPNERGYQPQVPPFVYVSAAGAEKLFASSPVARQEAIASSATRDFKAFDMKTKVKLSVKYKSGKVSGNNVIGYLEGSDPKLKAEAVVFSAHYDAYGKDNGKVYVGAADNALGTAEMLAVAEAFAGLSEKPKRSMIFIAVTGEEYGLYGSKEWAKKPSWDVKKIAANLNLDGVGTEVYGPVKTIVGYGAEHSSLGSMLNELARPFGVDVIPDPVPEERIFLRSDHYSFVERGIPALMLKGAPAGDKEIWMKRMEEWRKTDYHLPSDTIQADWAWEGAETVAEVMGILAWRISESAEMPNWLPSSRFGKLQRGNTKELPSEN